ncbi:MAG: peptidylprolyl isomerase [Bdellovibrionales bacterium]|jgi:peptidyl-prolyl cis-trans isomerase B (cyclophilin B)|nr:peptidylprolyl isomerase [Bdellovibrionales bacterium]
MKYVPILLFISFNLFANTKVVLETSAGDIHVQLDDKKAPLTVQNFLKYVKKGHYNGTIFHRVIDNFMIQGGGFEKNMRPKETLAPILNEADNGLSNDIGTISMARTNDVHSATSQFFINVSNNDFLNHKTKSANGYGYAVFGKVVKGMTVINRIKKSKTTSLGMHKNVPIEPIIIKNVRKL